MNFKERKARVEQDVVASVKQAVNEGVVVKASYNLEHDIMGVVMSQSHKNEKTGNINNVVYYQIAYNSAEDTISIYAFSRVYHYDELSVLAIINEPVAIDEKFMFDMKQIIKHAMSLIDQPAPTPVESESEGEGEVVE